MLLLSQLLIEDYIKWRPPLLRCFAVTLVDPEPALRAAAHCCLFDLLLPRNPLMGFNHLFPLLFALNGCVHAPRAPSAHDGISDRSNLRDPKSMYVVPLAVADHPCPLSRAEKAIVELKGGGQQGKRLAILCAILGTMDDEHKLLITSKLCHDVLAAVPDGHLPLEAAHWVLADALALLACKEIKLCGPANRSGGVATLDGADDNVADGDLSETSSRGSVTAVKSRLLSVVARKAMVESIVPIVIELKRHLELLRSPLLKDVFVFLRELLHDHKVSPAPIEPRRAFAVSTCAR